MSDLLTSGQQLGAANSNAVRLQVKTADESGAGTDSNIFVILCGELGRSEEIRLNPLVNRNAFERNSTETIELKGLPPLGRIYAVKLRSDTRYAASGWRLSWLRATPRDPAYAASAFDYHGWITDTRTKELYANDWPWPVTYEGNTPETNVSRRISLFNLLDADETVEQSYEVTYELENQVEVAVDVKETTKLGSSITWSSPETLGGTLEATVSGEWGKEIDNKRVDTTRQKLVVTDVRKQTFPAGKLTLVAADWTELWEKAIATLGSTSIAVRWLQMVPMNPSWTVGSYAPGDRVPEPFAGFLRERYPDLARLFVCTREPVKPVIGALRASPARPHAGKPLTVAMPVSRSDTGEGLPAVTRLTIEPEIDGKALAHKEVFEDGTASLRLEVPANAKGKKLRVRTTVKFGGRTSTKAKSFSVV
jgi:PLAT/LH2 domain